MISESEAVKLIARALLAIDNGGTIAAGDKARLAEFAAGPELRAGMRRICAACGHDSGMPAEQPAKLAAAESEARRYSERDGNAKIELVHPDCSREQLKIVDFGVADNCYVVKRTKQPRKATVEEVAAEFCRAYSDETWDSGLTDSEIYARAALRMREAGKL